MRRLSLFFLIPLFLGGCAHGPLKLATEKRYSDGIFSGFSSRVVEYSQISSDGKFLYFGTQGGRLYAASPADASERWSVKLAGSIDTEPGFGGGLVFVGTSKGRFHALRESDGVEAWHYDVPGEILGRPVVVENTVLFGANDGVVYALRAEKGELQWRYRRDLPDRMTVHGFAGVLGDPEAITTAFSDGSVAALKLSGGELIWAKNMPAQGRFSDVTTLLKLGRGPILAGQFDGALYALSAAGEIEWTFLSGGSAALPVAVKDQVVIPMPGNKLALIDPESGAKKWEFDAGETARWSGLVPFGPHLLAATFEGKMYVLDPETGSRQWVYDFGAAVQGAPVVVGAKAWVLTRKGRLFSLVLRGS